MKLINSSEYKLPSVRHHITPSSSTFGESVTMGSPQHPFTKHCLVPQRYILFIMGAIAVMGGYLLRYQSMIILSGEKAYKNACQIPDETLGVLSDNYFPFNVSWTRTRQNLFISMLHWGSLLTQLPAGYVSDQYGGKHILTITILGSALCNILFPLLLTRSQATERLLALQLLNGFFQGGLNPSLVALLAQWTPTHNRTAVFCFVYGMNSLSALTGRNIGAMFLWLGLPWSYMFYVSGSLGLVWCVVWELLCHSRPDFHPCIGQKEVILLTENLEGHVMRHRHKVPWQSMVRSKPLWALVYLKVAEDCFRILFVMKFGEYLKVVLRINTESQGVWILLPNMPIWVTLLIFGSIADWLIHERHVNVTVVRKATVASGICGTILFLLFVSSVKCERLAAIFCFTIAFAFLGAYYCTMLVNAMELAPNFGGVIYAFIETIGVTIMTTALIIVDYYTANIFPSLWSRIFVANVALLFTAGVGFVLYGSGERQPWNSQPLEE